MRCNNCGYESNKPEDIYCNYCGQKLTFQFNKAPEEKTLFNTPDNNGTYNQNNSYIQQDTPYQNDAYAQQGSPYQNNSYSQNNPYAPQQPLNSNNGSSDNKKLITTVCIAVSAVICVALIALTIIIVTKSNTENSVDDTTVKSGSVHKEEQADNAYSTSYYDGEDADNTARIPAGTRCKVDGYIDGARSTAVRSSPNKNASAVAWAGRDNYVTVIENYYSGDYIKVSLISEGDTYKGWVLVKYLEVVSDNAGIEHTELSPGTKCHVTYSDGLNLWVKPHADSERRQRDGSKGKVPYGATVEIVYQYNINDNGYVYASYNGKKGWVDAEYLELGSGTSTTKKPVTTKPTTTTTKPTEPKNDLPVDHIRESFLRSQEAFEYYYFNVSVNEDEKYEEGSQYYYKVTDDMDTMEELESALSVYFTDSTCDKIISERYVEIDGELYFDNGGTDFDDSYTVKKESVYKSGNGWIYELTCDVNSLGMGYSGEDTIYYDFEHSGSNYVFEMDIGVLMVNF